MKVTVDSPVWHPFSIASAENLSVERGDGAYLELSGGRKVVDCISSWWVNLHGHAHPTIAEAIYNQSTKLEQVIFSGFTHEPAETFSKRLLKHVPPGLTRVFFSDNGSTAVEVALKMAYGYWQAQGQERDVFIGFEDGYHGDTVGAMSIGGSSTFWGGFKKLMFPIEVLPYPSTFDGDEQVQENENLVLEKLQETLEIMSGRVAGVFIEPLVQGAGGMKMCRPEFLRKLSEACAASNVLLIFDEVMTGFGRTGDWFACKKAGITPDLLCLSKGITGGFMPMSVTLSRESIFAAFSGDDSRKMFFHGHSYTANPLACAAANASLTLLEQDPVAYSQVESWHRQLSAPYLTHESIKRLRITGTIMAFDIECGEGTSYFASVGPTLRQSFLEANLLIRPLGNTVYLMLPYCSTFDLYEEVYSSMQKVLSKML